MSISGRFRKTLGDFDLDVSFDVPSRDLTAVFGPSGCGKTSLLRLIAGLDRVENGRLEVGGDVWQDETVFLPTHVRRVGYVFQSPELFRHLDVRRNLEYGFRRVPAGQRTLPFERAVSMLGLESLLDRDPRTLSGGERQRAAIARALLAGPRLLLMDEPLAALDDRAKAEIFPFLERLHRESEIPVFYVSHSRDEVARLADNLLLMDGGRITGAGPVAEMLTRVDLPLARGAEAESMIEVVVSGHDPKYDVTYLDFPGGRFTIGRTDLDLGCKVRLRVLARDISLTLEHQRDTSILNIIPARVVEVVEAAAGQMLVKLETGGVPIISRITRKSADALDIRPGLDVHMQIKTVAVLA